MEINDDLNDNHIMDELEAVQQQPQSKRKKINRGNRKLQRYRQKLRKQGVNSTAIDELVNIVRPKADDIVESEGQQMEANANVTVSSQAKTTTKSKRKNRARISKAKPKSKTRVSAKTKKVKALPITKTLIDYESIPDQIFSRMFSEAFHGIDTTNFFPNELDQIQFTRNYTNLIDQLCYIELQEFQWKYYHYIGMTQNIWKGHIAKHIAERNSVYYTYGRSKTIIEQHLKQIENHMKQARTAIQEFQEEILSKFISNFEFPATIRELSSIIHRFVHEKQWSLHHDFQYKREILILDATDHQLTRTFFDQQPNKSQITSARRIWRATMEQLKIEQEMTLLQHRLTSSESPVADNLLGHIIDGIDKILENTIETTSKCTNVSENIKKMRSIKEDIIDQAMITGRTLIGNHNITIQSEKKKFLLENRYIQSTSEWQQTVLNAIETRRLHMIKRSKFIIQHKLNTQFNTDYDLLNT